MGSVMVDPYISERGRGYRIMFDVRKAQHLQNFITNIHVMQFLVLWTYKQRPPNNLFYAKVMDVGNSWGWLGGLGPGLVCFYRNMYMYR